MKIRVVIPLMIFVCLGFNGFTNNKITSKGTSNTDLISDKNYISELGLIPSCPINVDNNIISTSDATVICEGNVINFTGSEPIITPSSDSSFQWQSSINEGIWEDISGATQIDYTTGNLAETTSFRRLVQFADCSDIFASNEILITVNSIPIAPDIAMKDSCGVSILTASNYTGTLDWSTGESTESITVTVAGDYSVTQTVDGCTSDATVVTAAPQTIPAITNIIETDPTVCEGEGSLEFTFTGIPDGTYDINYDGGSFTGVTVSGNSATAQATAGAYNNLTISVNECISEDGVNAALSDPNPPSVPTITLKDSCGVSVLTASNYTGTLDWSTGESTESITVTVAGDYSVTQTIDGCTSDAAVVTAAPQTIPAITNIIETDPTVCEGEGSLEFTFTGIPDGTYDINYDGGSFTGVTVSGNSATVQATAGTYNSLTISVNECISEDGINAALSDPNPPSVPTITLKDSCGVSILTASNYTGTLDWSTGESTESITVTVAGDYSVTQTVDGCTSDAAVVTAAPQAIPAITNIIETDPTVCESEGSLEFTFTGIPDGTYDINYDGGSFTGVTVSGNSATVQATAGTYNNLTISVNECISEDGVNAALSDPNPPSVPTITLKDSCGVSVLTASNYTGTLDWSTGESTESITVTVAGDYSVTQTVDGCTSDAAVVTAAPQIIPAITNVTENDPIFCQGSGALGFTFTGVPAGIYNIDYDGNSFSNVVVVLNTATVLTTAGTYSNLRITVNGCISSDGIRASLSDPNPPETPTIVLKDSCGVSFLTATNYTGTLSWSTSESTESIIVTEAGDYSLTQTIDGCTSDAAVATATPKVIPEIVTVKENNPANCNGLGSIEFTFIGVPDGNYDINYDSGSFSNVAISGNTATVQAPSGEYNNLHIIANECSSPNGVNAILSDPDSLTTPLITVENYCGTSVLTASNYTGDLLWSTGANTEIIEVNTVGEYNLVQQLNGCVSDTAKAIASPKTVPVISTITENDPEVCQGNGSLEFSFVNVPDGTYSIFYDGNSFSNVIVVNNYAIVETTAGTYNNLAIVVNGCSSSAGINASLSDPNPPPTPTIDVQNDCGESILTASNYTGTLSWSTGESTSSIIVNKPGNYTLTQNVDGCTSNAASANVTPKTIPEIVDVTVNDPANCEGEGLIVFDFTGVPNGTYLIEYDGGSFTNIAVSSNKATVYAESGTYNNLTISTNGCSSPNGINVTVNAPTPPNSPTISIENKCGESILTASNYTGTLYWSTGENSPTITVNSTGEYWVTQTIAECTSDKATAIANPLTIPEIVEITENDPLVCQGLGTLNFSFLNVPDGVYTIFFDGSSFSDISVVNNAATVYASARNYNNLRIVVNGCTSPNGIKASLSDPNPPSTPTILVEDNCGESILTATNYSGSLTWDTGDTTESIVVFTAREYSLIQTVDGCTSNAATAIANPEKGSLKPEIVVTNYCGESEITVANLVEDAWLFWEFNNQTDSTKESSIVVTEAGEYSIYQKQGNCISGDTTVTISSYFIPSPPIGSDKEICATEPLQALFAEATSAESNTDIIWFDSAIGGNEITSPVLNSVGTITYYAESVDKNTSCTSSSRTPVTLTIKTNPKYALLDTAIVGKPNNNVAVLIFPKDSLKYQWYLNNLEIPQATRQYYYIAESDRKSENTFMLEVELPNGCKTNFNYPYLLSDNEIDAEKSSDIINRERLFIIYPNPVNDNLNIALNSKNINYNSDLIVKIFTIDGSLVLSSPLDQNPMTIDIKQLNSGIYSVVIYDGQVILTSENVIVSQH